ncbi:MAG: hypothetical protein K8T10_10705 [Candidatus Eremiobacteraeota bacterium]|nr:hypothetical protein [Candidatus Eremiobacteraeota bacterium]
MIFSGDQEQELRIFRTERLEIVILNLFQDPLIKRLHLGIRITRLVSNEEAGTKERINKHINAFNKNTHNFRQSPHGYTGALLVVVQE